MVITLQSLFQAIAQAQDEMELRHCIIGEVSKYFAAKRCGLFLFDQLPTNKKFKNIVQFATSLEHNPVLRYLVEHHAPVHEQLILSSRQWKSICPRSDHGHVMAGPIVTNGSLVGGLGFTRDRNSPAFDRQNLSDLSAVCLHISTKLAAVRSQHDRSKLNTNCLTPREIQIAQLVAQGQTNAEIGVALWITENSVKQALKRMFRKLEVSSRAQMVALLLGASGTRG